MHLRRSLSRRRLRRGRKAGPPAKLEPLPSRVDTWLIEPLKAPEFSLPDLAGNMQRSKVCGVSFVLLNFWATTAPLCGDQLGCCNGLRTAAAGRGG